LCFLFCINVFALHSHYVSALLGELWRYNIYWPRVLMYSSVARKTWECLVLFRILRVAAEIRRTSSLDV
jgi:hypothetical protein